MKTWYTSITTLKIADEIILNTKVKIIGRAEKVSFPEFNMEKVPARIDTGARISSLWASNIAEKDGKLYFTFFDETSNYYDGVQHSTDEFEQLVISSSMGQAQKRYKVKMLIKIKGKKIRGSFTLANRSKQVYPILVGRNVLHGKFVVDVTTGRPLRKREREHRLALQAILNEDKVEL